MLATTRLKEGPGIPLFFLHGFLGTSSDWIPICSFLPPRTCIAIDLPGHGRSPFTPHFLEEMPQERMHLIGYSMGGRLALQYATRFPKRIASLTLLSTHPGLPTFKERKARLEQDAVWAKLLEELSIDEFLTRWYSQPLFAGFQPDLSMRRHQDKAALAMSLMHYSLGHQPRLPTDGAKILVGERDAKFRALFENATLIQNAGHAAHLENPKAVAEAIQIVVKHTGCNKISGCIPTL